MWVNYGLLIINIMGRAKDGMFGSFTGKVGNLVGYYLNGQFIIRSAARERTKKASVKEGFNRNKFAMAQAWFKPIAYVVKVGFKGYGTKTGGYKAAVSYALKNAFVVEQAEQMINPELIRISGGDLDFPLHSAMVLEEGNILRFNWDTATLNGDDYDQAILLAYDEDRNYIACKETAAFRSTGTDFLPLLQGGDGATTFHVYMGFVAQDRSRQSHSKYLGKIVID